MPLSNNYDIFAKGLPIMKILTHISFLICIALSVSGCGGDGIMGTGVGSGLSSPTQQAGTMPKAMAQRDIDCPKLDVLAGTAALRVASASEGAVGVNYQVSMGQTARECRVENNRIIIKVGVEGRVLIGTNGKSGIYGVPLRIVVKREKAVVYSKLTRLSVTVPNGDTQATFAHVEEGISLALTENNPADEYDILVGFDPTGKMDKVEGKVEGKKKRRG
jgi:hypothetical protein